MVTQWNVYIDILCMTKSFKITAREKHCEELARPVIQSYRHIYIYPGAIRAHGAVIIILDNLDNYILNMTI